MAIFHPKGAHIFSRVSCVGAANLENLKLIHQSTFFWMCPSAAVSHVATGKEGPMVVIGPLHTWPATVTGG